MSEKAATKIIESLFSKLELNEHPVPIDKIVDFFSIKIVPYDFPDNFSGVIREVKGKIVIGLNKNHNQNRRRFTLAHELGHYLLGHSVNVDLGLTDDVRVDDVNALQIDKEKEANNFAAELLMPKKFLLSDIANKKGSIKIPDLATRYQVSEQVASIRIINAGLINKL